MPERPSPEEIAKWDRFFAIECNNRAWGLSEAASRTQVEDEEMLHCAHAAALHWSKVGTELHNARATMLLAHVEAILGRSTAMGYAPSRNPSTRRSGWFDPHPGPRLPDYRQ